MNEMNKVNGVNTDKLSTLLYENPMTLERMRNIVTLYNLKVQDDITLEDLDHIIEDWEIVCAAYDVRVYCVNHANFNLGMCRKLDFTIPSPISLKLKGKPHKLVFPFTIEELVEYFKKYNITLRFEPKLVKNNYATRL